MQDITSQLAAWQAGAEAFAVARVVHTWGSSPRPVGSAMLINGAGEMAGSVSGGCVEGAVVQAARRILASGQAELLHFGVSNEEAWAVGLGCGGKLDVLVEPYRPGSWDKVVALLREEKEGVWISRLHTGEPWQGLYQPGDPGGGLPEALQLAAEGALQARQSTVLTTTEGGYFLQVLLPPPRLLIIGAAHLAAELVHLAEYAGFATTVIDPRGLFAGKSQFVTPPRQLYQAWPAEIWDEVAPDRHTYAALLTHEPRIDDQALQLLLRSPVAYIGALGSTRTHARRVERLLAAGFTRQEVGRIQAPIGLDIHAQGAREIALSIIGQLIEAKNRPQIGLFA